MWLHQSSIHLAPQIHAFDNSADLFSIAHSSDQAQYTDLLPPKQAVVLIKLNFQHDTPSSITSAKQTFGYPSTTTEPSDYQLEFLDTSGNILSSHPLSHTQQFSDEVINSNFSFKQGPAFTSFPLRLPKPVSAVSIQLTHDGQTISSLPISTSPKPTKKIKTYTIQGNEAIKLLQKSKTGLSHLVSPAYAQTSSTQSVDLVFVSQNFSSSQMSDFHNAVDTYISALLSLEPFKSRASQFTFHVIENTTDVGCTSPFSCEPDSMYVVGQILTDSGLPVDTAALIINTTSGGGTATSVPYETTITGKSSAFTFVHEFGHSFGRLKDEYNYSSGSSSFPPKVYANCLVNLQPPAPDWNDIVPLSEYTAGCSYPTNYRSAPKSIMLSSGYHYFNAISQLIIYKKIEQLAGSTGDITPPSITINSPQNNQTLSGIVTVKTTTTDNLGVGWVDISIDGVLTATKFYPPFELNFDTSKLSSGYHQLSARSHDASGNIGLANITFIIGDTPFPSSPTTPSPSPTADTCPADIYQDGFIDITDFSILSANFLSTSPSNPRADIYPDGIVDLTDFSILSQNFLSTCN